MKKRKDDSHISFIAQLIVSFQISFFPLFSFSQIDSNTTIMFDFNEHQIKERNNKVKPTPVGLSLTYDRFGNEECAIYLHGHASSYLNLGTSQALKPRTGTISMWVNMDRRIYLGRGHESNPFLFTRNSDRDDFHVAFVIGYEASNKRLGVCIAQDSTKEVVVYGKKEAEFQKWNHLVMTFDDHHLSYYLNGELQGACKKNFINVYLNTDSVLVGLISTKKNERYTLGMFDDIQIFHRALSDQEVLELYNEENPNTFQNYVDTAMKYLVILLLIAAATIILLFRNKRVLNKQQEQLKLSNRISQLELKAVKAQMNPHFISNCLVAVQDLIYDNQIETASNYIAKFSFYLRQVLNYSDENYISLNQEIEMIRLYVELEQLRFKDKFSFTLQCAANIELNDISVPSLITQPFLENAIWHGLLPLKEKRAAVLALRITEYKNTLLIDIEDNGVGRNTDVIKTEKSRGTQLALEKIDSLNRLSNNQNYKINILDLFDDQKNKAGTKIQIFISL